MRVAFVHSLPGRVRLRVMPDALCGNGAEVVAATVSGIAGVKSASLNPRSGSILVFYDGAATSEGEIHRTIQGIGKLGATAGKAAKERKANSAWSFIGYHLFRLLKPPSLKPLFTVVEAAPFLAKGLKSLADSRLDVAALDAAAVWSSLAQGNVNAASTLIMLLKTGEYLESWARQRSRENLAAALSLNVGRVWTRSPDGTERQIPYSDLRQGDSVVLRSGGLIPIDGKVIDGSALVNEAAMTGEPLGREKAAGAVVHAGTVVEEGELVAEVTGKGGSTRYEQIITLIEEGEAAKAGAVIRANRLADKAVPFTFAAAALAFLLTRNPRKAVSVLSVDYSCAIKLATPLAFLAAIREGLRYGAFFKGGAPLEDFAACDTVVFDKTGTLTMSAPALERIIPYGGFTKKEALKVAACLEEHFPHPMAKAIVAAALARGVMHTEEHSSVKYIAAHGIATEYRGKHTVIGSRHFIGEDEGVDLSAAKEDEERAAKDGYSVLYLAQENKLAAMLLIKDPVRPEATEAVAMLRSLGIKRMYLLTGDSASAAERVSRELSLDGWRCGLLPRDKTEIVRNLRALGCKVAFVGDGMNDSPAMSAADVGIAMKDGADIACETADIALKESGLYPLVIARLISQRVMKRIDSNTRAAIVLNSIFILMGLLESPADGKASGSRSVWLHNLTSLALSMNAMRPVLKD